MLVRKFAYSAVLLTAVIGIGFCKSCVTSWSAACGVCVLVARVCIWQRIKKIKSGARDLAGLYQFVARLSITSAVLVLCFSGLLSLLLSGSTPAWPLALAGYGLALSVGPLIDES